MRSSKDVGRSQSQQCCEEKHMNNGQGRVQKRLCDTGWTDEKKCEAVACKKTQRDTGCTSSVLHGEVRHLSPDGTGEMASQRQEHRRKIGSGKKELLRILCGKVRTGRAICRSEDGGRKSTRGWNMLPEGFRDHVTTDGTVLGI